MTDQTMLITNMAVLAGIFLLGLLAKLFPRNGRKSGTRE
jgi:hypothetical protein